MKHRNETTPAPRGAEAMKPFAATYSRVSLDAQVDNFSLPSQRRAMLKLAAEKGYQVPSEFEFSDPGGLGGELDRPGLSALRAAVRSGAIAALIVHDPDRLSRKLVDLLLIVEECERANVALLFVNGAVDATPEGKAMLSMRGIFAELEKTRFAERVARGRKEKAQQGHVNGGRAPYGFRYEGKQQNKIGELVIHAEEAAVVRRIFTWAEEGVPLREMALRLAAEGTRPQRAKRWAKPVLRGILRSAVYTGEHYYNRRKGFEPAPEKRRKPAPAGKSKKTSQTWRDPGEWIKVPCPRLISDAQFARVEKRLAGYGEAHNGRPTDRYSLKGLVKCGLCGRACYGYPNRNRPYYRCGNFDRLTSQRICPARAAMQTALELELLAMLSRYKDPAELAVAVSTHQQETRRASGQAQAERKAIWANVERLKARELKAAKLLLDAEIADSHGVFREDLKQAQSERRRLEERLRTLAPAVEVSPVEIERLSRILNEGFDGLDMRELFRLHIKQVRLGADGAIAEVEFHFPDPDADGGHVKNRKLRQSVVSGLSQRRESLAFTVRREAA